MPRKTIGKKTTFGAELIEGMKLVLAHQRGKVQLEQVWPKPINVKAIRKRVKMSQAEFSRTENRHSQLHVADRDPRSEETIVNGARGGIRRRRDAFTRADRGDVVAVHQCRIANVERLQNRLSRVPRL